VAAVAAQSIAVLATLIAREWPEPRRSKLEFFALSMWLCGVMLYVWIISLIFYRNTFFSYSATDSTRRPGSTWAQWRSRPWPA
jgi:Voltage-dependent anion channel